MSTGPEFTHVENPFVEQWISMGWIFTAGNLGEPSAMGWPVPAGRRRG